MTHILSTTDTESFRRRMRLLVVLTFLAGTATARAAGKEPSFSKDVKPFLTKYCVECHGAQKAKAGFNLSSYDDLMRGSKKKKALVPGKPDDSLLVMTLDGREKKMPPKKAKKHPTAKEIEIVKAWIKAGARNDAAATRGGGGGPQGKVVARRKPKNDDDDN